VSCRAFRQQITVGGRAAKFNLEDCGTRRRWYSNENLNVPTHSKLSFEPITMPLSYRQSDCFVLLSPVKPALQFEIRYEKRRYEKLWSGYSSPTTNFPAPASCSHLASPSRVVIGRQFHAGPRYISPIPARTVRNSRELSSIVSCKYKRLFAQHPCFDTDANALGVWPNRLLKFFRMCPPVGTGRNSRW
jgi:hypothetical protein